MGFSARPYSKMMVGAAWMLKLKIHNPIKVSSCLINTIN